MKKNNNKGFTMVELIIVIAILAILMVALVPTYIKYVESARVSNDQQIETGIEGALEVAIIDPEVNTAVADYVIWDCASGTVEVSDTTLAETIYETIGYKASGDDANVDDFAASSTTYANSKYTFTVDENGVTVTVE